MGRGPFRNLRAKATFATETKRVYFRLDALDSGLLILGYKVRSANFVLRRTTKLVVRTNDVANILETFGKVKLKKLILMHEISKWQTVVKGKSIRSDTRQFDAHSPPELCQLGERFCRIRWHLNDTGSH